MIREVFDERITTMPIQNAPPSVQNWDNLRSPSPAGRSRRSKSRRGSSPGGRVVEKELIIEREVREVSPSRTAKSGRKSRKSAKSRTRSASSSSSDSETIVERKIIESDDFEESGSVHLGPLALVRDRRKSRSDRDIKEEIRALESERARLRKERRHDDDDVEIVKVERVRERSPSRSRGEIVLVDRDEVVEVRKDRRGRMSLVR